MVDLYAEGAGFKPQQRQYHFYVKHRHHYHLTTSFFLISDHKSVPRSYRITEVAQGRSHFRCFDTIRMFPPKGDIIDERHTSESIGGGGDGHWGQGRRHSRSPCSGPDYCSTISSR